MSYASPSDMLARYDTNRLGQLVRDDGTQATGTELLTDTILQAVLDDASGLIDGACLAGGRYLPDALTGLTGQGKSFLLRINCDLAYGFLILRRGFTEAEASNLAPGFKLALQLIDKLKEGSFVFNVQANIEAGEPTPAALSSRMTLISSTTRLFGDLDLNPGFNP